MNVSGRVVSLRIALPNALIEREEHSNTYRRTPDGQRVALFLPRSTTEYSDRSSPTLTPAPTDLRAALATIDRHVHGYIDHARLMNAA